MPLCANTSLLHLLADRKHSRSFAPKVKYLLQSVHSNKSKRVRARAQEEKIATLISSHDTRSTASSFVGEELDHAAAPLSRTLSPMSGRLDDSLLGEFDDSHDDGLTYECDRERRECAASMCWLFVLVGVLSVCLAHLLNGCRWVVLDNAGLGFRVSLHTRRCRLGRC